MTIKYIECDCDSPEHTLRIASYPEDKELIITTFLRVKPLLTRLKLAFRYIIKHEPEFGYFSDTILSTQQMKELQNVINQTIE